MRSGERLYSQEEIDQAITLLDAGRDLSQVARVLCRPESTLRDRVMIERRRRRAAGQFDGDGGHIARAPNAVLLERERRIEARERQTLTGQLFGDPVPGFSALDRRSAAR